MRERSARRADVELAKHEPEVCGATRGFTERLERIWKVRGFTERVGSVYLLVLLSGLQCTMLKLRQQCDSGILNSHASSTPKL